MKAFFSFMIRWVIPVLGLIALSLIIWFVGPLLDVLVPEGRRWALIILVFAVWLRLLPSFGRGETVQIGWWTTNFLTWSGLKALILPSITLGLFQLTLLMRLVRESDDEEAHRIADSFHKPGNLVVTMGDAA